MTTPKILPPGSTIGILGGGQLGRMTAMAASSMGYRTHVFTPEGGSPASQVTDHTTQAAYDDLEALSKFAAAVDVATYEFENIPAAPIRWLAERCPVRPGVNVLETTQNRVAEKQLCKNLGLATAAFGYAETADGLSAALAETGFPAVLKTITLGYDGKGQAIVRDGTEATEAFARLGNVPVIAEALIDFAYEASVIVARGLDGRILTYDPAENRHAHHILAETRVPAPMAPETERDADRIARSLAEALDLTGLLCIELFVLPDGKLLVNEMAPRPHNSGHWTIDACVTSQFEQLVRCITGLPLGSTERTADAVMENLIGNDADNWPAILADPRAKLHLYGKAEARDGRKMGHVTRVQPFR